MSNLNLTILGDVHINTSTPKKQTQERLKKTSQAKYTTKMAFLAVGMLKLIK